MLPEAFGTQLGAECPVFIAEAGRRSVPGLCHRLLIKPSQGVYTNFPTNKISAVIFIVSPFCFVWSVLIASFSGKRFVSCVVLHCGACVQCLLS